MLDGAEGVVVDTSGLRRTLEIQWSRERVTTSTLEAYYRKRKYLRVHDYWGESENATPYATCFY